MPSGISRPCPICRRGAASTALIAVNAIVPVFQMFGQRGRRDGAYPYYRLPTVSELTAMLATWASLVPHPAFDYSYTFGVQCTTLTCPAPQAIASEPSLQAVVSAHNAGG